MPTLFFLRPVPIDTKAVKSRCANNTRSKPDLLQLVHVIFHGLFFGHVAQFLPGLPFLALDHFPKCGLRLGAGAFAALLEEGVEAELQVVRRLVRALGHTKSHSG